MQQWSDRGRSSRAVFGRRLDRLLAALVVVLFCLVPATPAAADFSYVAGGFTSSPWATVPGANADLTREVEGLVVRPDGSVIVSAERALHLLSPAGGVISAANQFGPSGLDAYQLLLWRGRLWASVQEATPWLPCFIYELDPLTGTEIHRYSWSDCLLPEMTVDPRTDELVMRALVRSDCSPCRRDQRPLEEWDPITGKRTTLLAQLSTPYSATAFSPDGSTVYISEVLQDPARRTMYIDAYSRPVGVAVRGSPQFRIPLPNFSTAYSMTASAALACLQGSLLYTDLFADVYQVRDPSPTSTTSRLITTTPMMPGPVHYATLAGTLAPGPTGGLLVVTYSTVSALGCDSNPGSVGVGTPTPPHLFQVASDPVHRGSVSGWAVGAAGAVMILLFGWFVQGWWRQWSLSTPPSRERS
jgi:hypothetical protein